MNKTDYIMLLDLLDMTGYSSIQHQLRKIEEEVDETREELFNFKRDKLNEGKRLIEESLDVLQSSLSLIKLVFDVFDQEKIDYCVKQQRIKMHDRNYTTCGNCYIRFEIKENV